MDKMKKKNYEGMFTTLPLKLTIWVMYIKIMIPSCEKFSLTIVFVHSFKVQHLVFTLSSCYFFKKIHKSVIFQESLPFLKILHARKMHARRSSQFT